jgi:hypothetical protein
LYDYFSHAAILAKGCIIHSEFFGADGLGFTVFEVFTGNAQGK